MKYIPKRKIKEKLDEGYKSSDFGTRRNFSEAVNDAVREMVTFDPARSFMNSKTFWAKMTCGICGATGAWPFIPYNESGEHVSARPSDCAAVFLCEPRPLSDLHPQFLAEHDIDHEIVCPNCYRFGETIEENGAHKTAFEDMSLNQFAETIFGNQEIGNIQVHHIRHGLTDAFKNIFPEDSHTIVETGDSIIVEFAIPFLETNGDASALNISHLFAFHRLGEMITKAITMSTRFGEKASLAVPAGLWTGAIPDTERNFVFDTFFSYWDRVYSIFEKLQAINQMTQDEVDEAYDRIKQGDDC